MLTARLDEVTQELDVIKKGRRSREGEKIETTCALPNVREEYQRILEQAKILEAKSLKARNACPASNPSESKLDELAVLMKQAQVEEFPKFSGDIRSWPLFLQTYKRMTKVASIDDVTNIGRLNKSFQGEARELVLDKLTFGSSPAEIIETPEKQYGRKDVILMSLSTELMKLPPVNNLRDTSLRKLALSNKTFVAQMKTLEMEGELRNSMLFSFLHQKLSNVPSIYQKWAGRKSSVDEGPSMEVFANFFMAEWESLPPSLSNTSDSHQTSSPKSKADVNVHSPGSDDAEGCLFCNEKHETAKCSKFQKLTVEERWNLVRKERICFVCLASRNHRSPNCPSGQRCGEAGCNKPHSKCYIVNGSQRKH